MQVIFVLLSFFFCVSGIAIEADQSQTAILTKKLQQACLSFDTKRLSWLLRETVGFTLTLDQVEHIADYEDCICLKRAIQATKALFRLQENVGLTSAEMVQIALFLETDAIRYIEKSQYYVSAKESRLARSLEYDPETGQWFIHLEMHAIPVVGIAPLTPRAVLYDVETPQIVLRSSFISDRHRKIKIARALQGQRGIADILAITEHHERGKLEAVLYSKMYKPGSLKDIFQDPSFDFTLHEKVKIALDLLSGLETLHKHNIVHTAITPENILIQFDKFKGQRKIEAVLSNFSYCFYGSHGKDVFKNLSYIAPEDILHTRMPQDDYLTSEIFALGSVLYRLYYGENPKWLNPPFMTTEKSLGKRYEKYVTLIHKCDKERRLILSRKASRQDSLSTHNQFEAVILQMVNPNPNKRGSIEKYRQVLAKCLTP